MYLAIPPLLPVHVTGELLGLSPATSYRVIRTTLPRVPLPGRWRVLTTDVEKLIGRAITADEYLRAVTKTRSKHRTDDGPETDAASRNEDVADAPHGR
ncbi:MAG TPA: hypothetical protein VII91_10690 [Bauldia sp.]